MIYKLLLLAVLLIVGAAAVPLYEVTEEPADYRKVSYTFPSTFSTRTPSPGPNILNPDYYAAGIDDIPKYYDYNHVLRNLL